MQAAAMVQVDWRKIRSLDSSQRSGFEEFCCQLAHCEPVPSGAVFTRKRAPDGGVECYWTLTGGAEWGWQAKFFPGGLETAQWVQCDESVKTALEKHASLTRLFVCFPVDLPDARVARKESAMAHWNKRVEKWTGWAKARGQTVEFVRWDQHELLLRLSGPAQRGRLWFWFNAPALDSVWFSRAASIAAKQAKDRYTPELHFDLPVEERFEALARDEPLRTMVAACASDLADALHQADKCGLVAALGEVGKTLEARIRDSLTAVSSLPADVRVPIDFTVANVAVRDARNAATEAIEQFWEIRQASVDEFQGKHGRVPTNAELPDPEYATYALREIEATLRKVAKFLGSENARLATRGAMMLTGDAGFGKTHLLCSITEKRAAAGRPIVLLLAERFDGSEPWTNALQLLGLTCSRDEFLGALDAAGEVTDCRALILIDAINEGEGLDFWNKHLAAILAEVAQFPHVGIAFSIRSPYVRQLGALPDQTCVSVAHFGFAGQVAAASRHFFQRYELAEPNVPVLNPEFENPLFLKLVCEALKHSGGAAVPADFRSVTSLFGFVLTSVNQRLAATLDYDESEERVARAIHRLAQLMAEAGVEYLPVETVRAEFEQIHPSTGYSKSLLRHLISEHLLVRLPRSAKGGKIVDVVRFTYQRLSDHLIIRCLLAGKTKGEARRLFRDGPLARYSEEPLFLNGIAGWVEALAIQLPEAYALEIDEVAPIGFEDGLVCRAFFASMIWRKPEAFTKGTKKRIDAFLGDTRSMGASLVLDAIIAVTACADHPYNAEWLDQRLRPMILADRDAFWSAYLFGKNESGSSVARLIDWAWTERENDGIPDSVVLLAAKTLTWCFTSSDRFVRDRATKAFVALLDRRVHLVELLLQHFSGLDEPYLRERLFAAAYGCALRGTDLSHLHRLAQTVFDLIFRGGQPPPSLLLRDHARGIVDIAVRRGLVLDFDPKKIVPPYSSDWPKTPPSLSGLAERFRAGKYDEEHAGLRRIFHSVTGDDFNHYVVNDVTWWHRDPLKRRQLSPRRAYEELLGSISTDDADTLRYYAEAIAALHPSPSRTAGYDAGNDNRRSYVALVDQMLPRMLGVRRARFFLTEIVPYLKDTWNYSWDRHFPVELFQRLILRRVLELGWTSERLNDVDRHINSGGREPNKPERIGKKYQWIAYDEFHARISDNFGLAESRTRIMDEKDWLLGTWPDSFRDIDPSLLLRATPRAGLGKSVTTWWSPKAHLEWNADNLQTDWLQRTSDLPPVEDFLRCRRADGSWWIMLNNYASWRRSEFGEKDSQRTNDRYEVHYIINSYFVRRAHLEKTVDWGHRQNWINDLLPSPRAEHRKYLHEYFESVHFDGVLDDDWVTETHPHTGLPHPVLPSTTEYMAERGTYDCSVDDTVIINLPSRALAKMGNLRVVGSRGEFVDAAGKIVAFDPSTHEPGRSALAFDEATLRQFLDQHDLALVWTLLGEKNIYPPSHGSKWLGRLTLLGLYSWDRAKLNGRFRAEFMK